MKRFRIVSGLLQCAPRDPAGRGHAKHSVCNCSCEQLEFYHNNCHKSSGHRRSICFGGKSLLTGLRRNCILLYVASRKTERGPGPYYRASGGFHSEKVASRNTDGVNSFWCGSGPHPIHRHDRGESPDSGPREHLNLVRSHVHPLFSHQPPAGNRMLRHHPAQ